jgi:hypothetical protein
VIRAQVLFFLSAYMYMYMYKYTHTHTCKACTYTQSYYVHLMHYTHTWVRRRVYAKQKAMNDVDAAFDRSTPVTSTSVRHDDDEPLTPISP